MKTLILIITGSISIGLSISHTMSVSETGCKGQNMVAIREDNQLTCIEFE